VYEWVHFQHLPDNTRKVLFRGEVKSKESLAVVLEDDDTTYTSYGIQALTCIQREDFGMTWNLDMGDGGS
jgi:hypothetical protein